MVIWRPGIPVLGYFRNINSGINSKWSRLTALWKRHGRRLSPRYSKYSVAMFPVAFRTHVGLRIECCGLHCSLFVLIIGLIGFVLIILSSREWYVLPHARGIFFPLFVFFFAMRVIFRSICVLRFWLKSFFFLVVFAIFFLGSLNASMSQWIWVAGVYCACRIQYDGMALHCLRALLTYCIIPGSV